MSSKWEPYKQKIKELYIDEKKTLEEVRYTLENEEGFTASKSEYERQLKTWDFKKNRKNEHVKLIKIKLEARQGQKSETDVYLRGVRLPRLEIQRKAQRCFLSVTERHELQRCATPPEVLIITPTSELYMTYVRSRDLPWLCFQRQVDSIEILPEIINMPREMLEVMLPSLCPNPSPLISRHLNQMIHYLCTVMPVDQDSNVTEILQKIFGGERHATIEFLKLAVYLLSNKLLPLHLFLERHGPRQPFCDQLLKWFQMKRNHLFLRDILVQKSPTVEAFAEDIFSSALHDEDGAILRVFLESGLSPDMVVYDRLDEQYYRPLQTLTRRGNLDLIQMFVEIGADINANNTVFGGDLATQTPLQLAARRGDVEVVTFLMRKEAAVVLPEQYGASALQNAAMAGSLKLVSMLIENGAHINVSHGVYGCALSCAILVEASSIVELLLQCGADVNCDPGQRGYTPLESAAKIGDRQIVHRLLKLGANANTPVFRRDSRTTLQWAAVNGDLEMCHTLIQAGADVNAPEGRGFLGESALICAVGAKNRELAALLIKHGANVNYRHFRENFVSSETALETAISLNDVEMVQLLLSALADPNQDESIVYAIQTRSMELINILLGAGADIRNRGLKVLCAAVETQDVDTVKFWISQGACTNNESLNASCAVAGSLAENLPLVRAVELDNLPIIETLFIGGADCNLHGNSNDSFRPLNALQMACSTGNTKLFLYLLDKGADLNWPAAEDDGRTALQAAVEFGDIEFVKLLIDSGANVNAPPAMNRRGFTALQAAIMNERLDLVQILLKAGAHAENALPHRGGSTSLQVAAKIGNNELVRLLLDRGAEVNSPAGPNGGMTALQAASSRGHYQTVQLLLSRGADVNARASSRYGRTALQSAAGSGYLTIARILLEAGASVDAENLGGLTRTAIEAAANHGHIDMLKLLLNFGADITRTKQGRRQLHNALENATRNGHNAAAKFLKYHQIG